MILSASKVSKRAESNFSGSEFSRRSLRPETEDKRCEPAYVKEIPEVAALVRGCLREALSAATCATAATRRRIFMTA